MRLRRSFARAARAIRNEPARAPPRLRRARIGAPWEARWNSRRLRRVHPVGPTRDFEEMEFIYPDAQGAVASVRLHSRTVAHYVGARTRTGAGKQAPSAQQWQSPNSAARNARRRHRNAHRVPAEVD